jgi:transposase
LTGELSPLAHGGGKPARLSAQQRLRLRRKVRERDVVALAQLRDYLREEEQVEVNVSTICRALRQSDLPRKKVPSTLSG